MITWHNNPVFHRCSVVALHLHLYQPSLHGRMDHLISKLHFRNTEHFYTQFNIVTTIATHCVHLHVTQHPSRLISINSCSLSGYVSGWQTRWCTRLLQSSHRIRISSKTWVTFPVKLTCSSCTEKLREKCRSKANYVVWHVELISRYFTKSTKDLPAHARSRNAPCDWLGCYLFGYSHGFAAWTCWSSWSQSVLSGQPR